MEELIYFCLQYQTKLESTIHAGVTCRYSMHFPLIYPPQQPIVQIGKDHEKVVSLLLSRCFAKMQRLGLTPEDFIDCATVDISDEGEIV